MNLKNDMCIDCLAIKRIVIVFCLLLLALKLPHKMFFAMQCPTKLRLKHWKIYVTILKILFVLYYKLNVPKIWYLTLPAAQDTIKQDN